MVGAHKSALHARELLGRPNDVFSVTDLLPLTYVMISLNMKNTVHWPENITEQIVLPSSSTNGIEVLKKLCILVRKISANIVILFQNTVVYFVILGTLVC